MRVKKFENFLTELIGTDKCVDINYIDKYIRNSTSNDLNLAKRQLDRARKLLEERYERYGAITEEDNVEAFKKGYFDLGKIGLTIDEIRRRIARFKVDRESPIGMQIEKDWDHAAYLLQDLLQLENMNLISYVNLLEDRVKELRLEKKKKKAEVREVRLKREAERKFVSTLEAYPSDLITVEELCALLHVSKSAIYHMKNDRELPHYKLTPHKRGRLYFSRSEIEELIRSHRIGTVEEFCARFD